MLSLKCCKHSVPTGEEYILWTLALYSFLLFSLFLVQIFSSEPSLQFTESMFMYLACQTSKLYTNFPFSHILAFADSIVVHIPFCQSEETVLIIFTLSHDTVSYHLLKLGC